MTTAAHLISLAESQVGTQESPTGSNNVKYGVWSGYNYQPWCGSFVSWVFAQAGAPLPDVGIAHGFVYCPSAVNWAKAHGVWSASGHYAPGDIVLYCWDGSGLAEHTGIVVHDDGSQILTVEGNTGSANLSNGGEVCKQYRPHGSTVLGVWRTSLMLSSQPAPPPVVKLPPVPPFVGSTITHLETFMVNVQTVQLGSDDAKLGGGHPVRNVQAILASHGYAVGKLDGVAGPITVGLIKHVQQAYGLSVTGKTDGPTLAHLMGM